MTQQRVFMCVSSVFAILGLATASTIWASVHVVQPDGSGDFPTIQSAVDASIDGDVIELTDGIFRGDGNRDVDYRGKGITIRSQSGNAVDCVVDCEGNSADPHRGFRFASGEDATSILEGITVRNGYGLSTEHGASFGGGVYCRDASPTIRSCVIAQNSAQAGGGIACVTGSIVLDGCIVVSNVAEFGGGLFWSGEGAPVVQGCTFVANTSQPIHGAGIYFIGALPPPTLTLENSIIAFNNGGEGVRCDEFGGITVSCSDIYGNEGGDWVGCIASQDVVRGNLAMDPLFCDLRNNDFHLNEASPCAPDHNPECGLIGAWPVNCGEPTVVRDSSWGRIKSSFKTGDRRTEDQ